MPSFTPEKAQFSRKAPRRSSHPRNIVLLVGACLVSCVSAYNFGLLIGRLIENGEGSFAKEDSSFRGDMPLPLDRVKPPDEGGARNISKRIHQLRLPNVLLIGAQKAGSTALAALLFNSGVCRPEVFDGEPNYYSKEVHYFDRTGRYKMGPSFYAKRFRHCSDDSRLLMDATPAYFSFPEKVRATYDAAGNGQADRLKIIMILREPVSRELSVYNHKADMYRKDMHQNSFAQKIVGKDGSLLSFEDYAEQTYRFIKRSESCSEPKMTLRPYSYQHCLGLYAVYLKEWITFFDPKNILVLSYSELKESKERLKWRVNIFLGLDEGEQLGEMEKKNAKESEHKLDLPPCNVQSKLASIFDKSNRNLYRLLRAKSEPAMEQRPFPKFLLSNCTGDISKN